MNVHVVVDDGDERAALGMILVTGRHRCEAGAREVEAHPGREGFEFHQRHPSSFSRCGTGYRCFTVKGFWN